MSICTAPVYELKELKNLFIEMTSKNCNQRCSSCYIDFPNGNKSVKDFISVDTVKAALADINKDKLQCIYLMGAEPMTHPEFNLILRLCLKFCNVCICTNSSFLNEKKIRFLKKVEEEGNNQIFFSFNLVHYSEIENDRVRYRGNFRQTIAALKNLNHYNFISVLSIQNYYKLPTKDIRDHFSQIFKINEISNTDLKITISYPLSYENEKIPVSENTDCMYGRVLSRNGVYTCSFLANDYRGRSGSSFKDYSKTMSAETDFCVACSNNNECLFSIG